MSIIEKTDMLQISTEAEYSPKKILKWVESNSVITIKTDVSRIKFYNDYQDEPLVTIYRDNNTAVINSSVVESSAEAIILSQAVAISGIFLTALNTEKDNYLKNFIDIIYVNMINFMSAETKYSPRKILKWIESDNVITVNKKDRIKYQFGNFAYRDGKLIIFYKPVAW